MKCEHEGCGGEAQEYRITAFNDDGSDAIFWYCAEHAAADGGFCCYCSHFTAGADDRYLYSHGVCEDCMDGLRSEAGDYDTYEDYYP